MYTLLLSPQAHTFLSHTYVRHHSRLVYTHCVMYVCLSALVLGRVYFIFFETAECPVWAFSPFYLAAALVTFLLFYTCNKKFCLYFFSYLH